MDNKINDSEAQLQETLGCLLKRTRTKQKLTLEDANKATRIHLNSLQALENDDFDSLPAEVFVRGFIKLYAEFLGLDPEDTIRHYISQEKASQAEDLPEQSSSRDILSGETLADHTSFFKKYGKIITVTLLLAILLLFYGLGIFFKKSETNDNLKPSVSIEEPLMNEELSTVEQKDAVTNDKIPRQIKAIDVASEITTSRKSQPAEAVVAEVKNNVVSAQTTREHPGSSLPKTVEVPTSPSVNIGQDGQADEFKYILEAKFNKGSLVTITVDDQPRRQYNSQAGIVRIWKANKKIVLKLGNRNDVDLTLNGKVLDNLNKENPETPIRIPEDITDNQQP